MELLLTWLHQMSIWAWGFTLLAQPRLTARTCMVIWTESFIPLLTCYGMLLPSLISCHGAARGSNGFAWREYLPSLTCAIALHIFPSTSLKLSLSSGSQKILAPWSRGQLSKLRSMPSWFCCCITWWTSKQYQSGCLSSAEWMNVVLTSFCGNEGRNTLFNIK